jgi:hypothetical protein
VKDYLYKLVGIAKTSQIPCFKELLLILLAIVGKNDESFSG